MTTEGFNARELVALTHWPDWAIAAFAVVLLVQLATSFSATRGAPPRVRSGLLALRALATAGLFALLLEPGLRLMATSRDPNRVVVALDVSASMAEGSKPEGGGTTRVVEGARAAKEVIADLQAKDGAFVPEVYVFDGELRPASLADLDALAAGAVPAAGKASSLAAPVNAVAASGGGGDSERPLGGVVVISDGADTTGLVAQLPLELAQKASSLGAPLHTIAVGGSEIFKDVALVGVVADDFAFVRNKVSFDVLVRNQGFTGLDVPLTLFEDGKPIATVNITLSDATEPQKVTFSFEPVSAGKRLYTVTAPVHPDEAIAENNRVDFPMKIIRDRIRVLQVAGRPSWDERFVRRLLKENPSVDLISFFILRSTTDMSGANNKELSLIPFPTRELFTEELHTFDVVIFQDFNYRPYQMGTYLENVRKFVDEQGGGFLMIGGDLSFSEGDYEGTPIAEILPMRLLPGKGHLSTEKFRPLVTEAGKSHPVTDLGDMVGAREGYDQLPELEGVNVTAGLVPGAEALLAHPYLNGDDGPLPVVAVREVGKGRSMAVATDSTWAWALPHVGTGGRGDAHRRFYANALRWLIKDPELSRVKVAADKATVGPAEDIALEVRSFSPRYAPEGGASVRMTFVPLDVATTLDPKSLMQEGVTGEDGAWRAVFKPPAPGAWRVRVEATSEGRFIGGDEDAFVVTSADREKLFREPRPDLLQALAEAGRGRAVDVSSATGLPFVDHKVERVHRQKTEPLWNRVWVLGAVVALFGAEWWWRRRRGFA